MSRLLPWIERLPKTLEVDIFLASTTGVLMMVIAVLDYQTGYYLGLSVFYVVPIMLITMVRGRGVGFLTAAACATLWAMVRIATRDPRIPISIPIWNAVIRTSFFVIIVLTLDSWMRERIFARRDALTGLANRAAFFEAVEQEMERSRRYHRPFTVAYLDGDRFKQINDTLGHRAGDAALQTLAQILRESVRKMDVVARLGGDEFAILMPETSADPVGAIFLRIQRTIAKAMREREWPLSVSVGIATFMTPPDSVDEVIEQADALMYSVKENPRSARVKQAVFGARG